MQQQPNPYPQYPHQQWQTPSQPLPQQQIPNYARPQIYYPPQQQWQQTQMPPQQQWNPQQQPFPSQQYQQPPQYQPPKGPKRAWYQRLFAWCRRHPIATAVIIVVFLVIGAISNLTNSSQPLTTTSTTKSAPTTQATQATQQPTPQPTSKPTPKPTVQPTAKSMPQPVHYPPTTEADLHALAAKGNASAIHEFHSESVGLTGACPQPKREVTVDPSITGQQLAKDLLAYFYANQLDNPCGSVVFAYHNQSEANDVYTAGRINLDVTDLSGNANVDPNATNLKYIVTLDIGGIATGQEYTVTY